MAITLYPFIIATKKERELDWLMNHEKIHIVQQRELWVLPFYILYLGHSLWLLLSTFSYRKCYYGNIFEAEAYANHHNFNYIKERERFQVFRRDKNVSEFRKEVLSGYSDWKDRLAAFGILFGAFSAITGIVTFLAL